MIKYETNSKLISAGQIFVAIIGNTVDGHNYIDEAIQNYCHNLGKGDRSLIKRYSCDCILIHL